MNTQEIANIIGDMPPHEITALVNNMEIQGCKEFRKQFNTDIVSEYLSESELLMDIVTR